MSYQALSVCVPCEISRALMFELIGDSVDDIAQRLKWALSRTPNLIRFSKTGCWF